ncbi:hypothetical protein BGC_06100 [Burkholderia sp. 3C]
MLPKASNARRDVLWIEDNASSTDSLTSKLELLEGTEYRYVWKDVCTGALSVNTDPEEMFQPDTVEGHAGRIRTGLSTGLIRVVLRAGDSILGELELEVRSRKLAYRSEYRWMLRDIAEQMTELVMDRFAVSDTHFEIDETRDAITLYQRFTFLRALFENESFQGALREVVRRPHVAWEPVTEVVRSSAGMRADSKVLRQLAKSGPRSAWPSGPIAVIPSHIERVQTTPTHDTPPNRFVKFSLEQWLQMLGDIDRGLENAQTTPATARGRREILAVMSQLEETLQHDVFADVGRLTHFPASDQVLQKREGYRDIFKAYIEIEFAARLSWQRNADDFDAGQRDVATLYEYWAFIQLSKIVGAAIGQPFDMSPLVRYEANGLTVGIRTGVETVLKGIVERFDRKIQVELCFNRTFNRDKKRVGSWTRPMRPDYSLLISPANEEPSSFDPIVIHFDAKYRVDFVKEIFGDDPEDSHGVGDGEVMLNRGGVLRADLLKMHAYRDAIHRTAGAYVIYPGGDAEAEKHQFLEYHELLPGLGAFVLRPTDSGHVSGTIPLSRFINDVLDHVATRLTRHERGRYWLQDTYGESNFDAMPSVLSTPPPDMRVLLGYVKNQTHWDWIRSHKIYNVRAEGRHGGVSVDAELLQSQILLLYCPSTDDIALARIVSDAERVSETAMKAMGYWQPQESYWCIQLTWLGSHHPTSHMSAKSIEQYARSLGISYGEPISVLWRDLSQ